MVVGFGKVACGCKAKEFRWSYLISRGRVQCTSIGLKWLGNMLQFIFLMSEMPTSILFSNSNCFATPLLVVDMHLYRLHILPLA